MSLLLTGAVVYGGGAAASSLVLTFTYRWWKIPFWSLFSRLQKPRILEQETRAQIYQFIQARPGVRAQQVLRGLQLATGQTMHHLAILQRQGYVTRTRAPFARRYFVKGTMSPQDMQAVVVREHPVLARVEMLVKRRPGLNVGEMAKELGTSAGQVSRLVQQLVDARLVERRPEGRHVRVFPSAPTVAPFETNASKPRRVAVKAA